MNQVQKQPTPCNIPVGGKTSIGISIWNVNTLLNIKSIEFLRETLNFGYLLSAHVEGVKSPVLIVMLPIKRNNNNYDFLSALELPDSCLFII